MITTDTRQDPRFDGDSQCLARPQVAVDVAAAKCVLIAEHRDEVFARLAHDLGATGHVVYRATGADEVPRIYSLAEACLAICNINLPDASGWLTATKLQMYRADARVWLYAPNKSSVDATWAQLSGVERVLYYQGDLFRLSDQIRQSTLRSNLPRQPVTESRVRQVGGKSR